MRFCIVTVVMLFGCATPFKGTADTAKPVRPVDEADTDVEDTDEDDADDGADDDGAAGDDGGPDTAEEPEEPPADYELEFTPSEVNFGPVSVGGLQSEIVNVRNVGLQSLHINSMSLTARTVFSFEPDFALPVTLTPGMARTIRVSFEPSEATAYSEQINFVIEEQDQLEDVARIPLQGRGEDADCDICSPIIEVSPRELTINTLVTCSATESVTVRNDGDQTLVISAVNVINDSLAVCGSFSTASGAMTIAPYGEAEIPVTYTATRECVDAVTLGSEENTLRITSNDPIEPVAVVGLTGLATCLVSF